MKLIKLSYLVLVFIALWHENKTLADTGETVKQLTREERILGLAKVWSEVKFNFANFDQVPDLDWDKAFQEYLPRAAEEQTNEEYYKLLQKFVALLHDDHTHLNLPDYIQRTTDSPPIAIEKIEGKAVIVRAGRTSEIKKENIVPGMQITKVDGRSIEEILQDTYHFIAASTSQGRDAQAYGQLLQGTKASKAAVEVRDLQGTIRTVTLTRDSQTPEGYSFHETWKQPSVEFKRLSNGIVYFAINSFGSETVVSEFDKVFDTLDNIEGMIIDVRDNGGGNSTYGDSIAGRLTTKPLKGNTGQTRQYIPMLEARGGEEFWLRGEGRLIQPRGEKRFSGPLVVLAGVHTASATEGFVSLLHGNKRAVIVGGKTLGSTGEPLHIQLPGGGSVRICINKGFYPDGRPYVGVGIIPDVEIYPTQRDIADAHDVVLEKGLEVLKGKMSNVSPSEVAFKTAYPAIVEGDYYCRHGQLSDAINSYKEALELEPDSFTVHLKLAGIYRQQNNEKEFLKHYNATGFFDDDAWMIIGPFENNDRVGFDAQYPPEKEIDFIKQYSGKEGNVKWFKPEHKQTDGFMNLASLLKPNEWTVAYEAAYVDSPEAREMQFRIGSDDEIKVWLNGKLVLSKNVPRYAVMDQDIVPVSLKSGRNEILVKVCNHTGSWGFYMRITDVTGKPCDGLRFVPQKGEVHSSPK